MVAYCKNNAVNMSDKNGFRPIYTVGEETDEMLEASLSAMSNAYTKPKTKYGAKDALEAFSAGAVASISEEGMSDTILGYAYTKWTGPLPIKFGDFDSYGKFFKVLGTISSLWGIQDNFSGKYSTSEAILMSILDTAGFVLGATLFASGGGAALVGGLALAAGVELGKVLINYSFNNIPALEPKNHIR